MNLLINALTAAAQKACIDIKAASCRGIAGWAGISRETSLPVAELLCADSKISELQGQWLISKGECVCIQLEHSAGYLIERAISVDPRAIVEDLYRIALERNVEQLAVHAVDGLTVTNSVGLGGGFYIEPPESLPKVEVTDRVFFPAIATRFSRREPDRPNPTAAITKKSIIELSAPQVAAPAESPSFNFDASFESRLEHALFAATVASGGGSPVLREQYSVITSIGWPGMACSGFGEVSQMPRIPVSGNFDAAVAISVFQLLETSFPKVEKLELAISRLKSSRRRLRQLDALIDLGTCLEALLMNDDSKNMEINHKIGMRAAWLLGRSGQERIEIAKCAKDLYDARSEAVHRGKEKIVSGEDATAAASRMERYDRLCASIIQKIAEMRGWPDWNKLTLNAG